MPASDKGDIFSPHQPLWMCLIGGILAWAGLFCYHSKVPLAVLAITFSVFTVGVSLGLSRLLLAYSKILNRDYKKRWVKALDFPYIVFGFIGLLRVCNGSSLVAEKAPLLDTVGLLFLALALSVRLSKTIIEVVFEEWQ